MCKDMRHKNENQSTSNSVSSLKGIFIIHKSKLACFKTSGFRAIDKFNISFFITGMHMISKYGKTTIEVKKFKGAKFFEFINQSDNDSLEIILSKTILGSLVAS